MVAIGRILGIKIINQPTLEELAKIPDLYSTEHIQIKDKLIYEHFYFQNTSHWYIAEFDKENTMFGYAILNNDFQNAEWGYIPFQELAELKIKHPITVATFEVERDLDWYAKPVKNIDLIKKRGGEF